MTWRIGVGIRSRGTGSRLGDDSSQQIEKRAAILPIERADVAGRCFDPAEHDRRVALEGRACAAARLGQHRLQPRGQPLGG